MIITGVPGGGYSVGKDRCIILRGGGKNPQHYEYNQIYNYKLFDSDYVSDEIILKQYDVQIRDFNAKYMQAYPSSVFSLAKNYKIHGIDAPEFDVIFLGSENVIQSQLDTIKDVFNPKIILYHYGHSEEVLLGIKNADNDGYGFLPQYGYCEVLNDNGRSVKASESGELTGTSWSKCMPFIRYRTNDFAIKGNESDGNKTCINAIEGRRQEFVVRNDGIKISIVSVCAEHMPSMSHCKEMQFEQFKPGELIINCAFYPGTDVALLKGKIILDMERKFEGKVKCNIKQVDHISRTKNSKNVMLIQHII